MLTALLEGRIEFVRQGPGGDFRPGETPPRLLFPGSFNPLHQGHIGLALAAERRMGLPAAYELSVVNVDKPDLSEDTVRDRLLQFRRVAPVYVTRAATFREKAALFPGCTFIVGADTAQRIVDERYYGSAEQLTSAMAALRALGARFFVGGRVDAEGRFIGLDALAIPGAYRELFSGLTEAEFRMDVSSSALRRDGAPWRQTSRSFD